MEAFSTASRYWPKRVPCRIAHFPDKNDGVRFLHVRAQKVLEYAHLPRETEP
jgi:hypothetical protein